MKEQSLQRRLTLALIFIPLEGMKNGDRPDSVVLLTIEYNVDVIGSKLLMLDVRLVKLLCGF